MHWGLALQNQCPPCSVLRCPVFIPLCLCSTIAPRSSKLCASGVRCHLEREPCLTAVHLVRVRDTDYTLLRMQRSLGVWGWAWRRAPPWSWGTLQFSLSGEDRRQWERGCLSLSLSQWHPHQTQSSQSSNTFKTRLHHVPNCWWGPPFPGRARFLISILNAQCPTVCSTVHSCCNASAYGFVLAWFVRTRLRYVCVLSHSVMSDSFAAPWTIAHQAPLSMEFSRQEYWRGLPCPPPIDATEES